MVLRSLSRFNLSMSRTAAKILEDDRQLPPGDLDWLVQSLINEDDEALKEEEFAAWQKEAGEPEPGYDEWFRAAWKRHWPIPQRTFHMNRL